MLGAVYVPVSPELLANVTRYIEDGVGVNSTGAYTFIAQPLGAVFGQSLDAHFLPAAEQNYAAAG